MENFHCGICNVTLKNNVTLQKHNKSNRHKRRVENQTKLNTCVLCVCGKEYSCRQSLYLHRKKCETYQNRSNQDDPPPAPTIEKQVEDLKTCIEEERRCIEEERRKHQEERDELRSQIVMLLEKFSEQSTPTVNNNTTNNIENQNIENMTININAFGNENLDYITDQVIIKCVGRIYNSIPVLIEKIHFDPKHPENHNIKITNRKLPYASVMTKSKKWKIMDKNDAIETMMDKSFNMLEMSYEENKDEMSEFNKERFEEFQNKFTQQDKETMKTTKKKVELAILNGSS